MIGRAAVRSVEQHMTFVIVFYFDSLPWSHSEVLGRFQLSSMTYLIRTVAKIYQVLSCAFYTHSTFTICKALLLPPLHR